MSVFTPYLMWIKLGGIAVLASVLFVGGCRYGTERQLKKDTAQIEKLDGWLNAAREQIAILSATLSGIDAETAKREEAGKAQAKRAESLAAQARKDADAYRKQLTVIERELAESAKDPGCKAQLEATVCSVLR